MATLGDPLTTSDYAFCLYDSNAGAWELVLEKAMPARASFKGAPRWKASGSGFRYIDGGKRYGPVDSMSMRSGVAGKARLSLKASGVALAPPALPLDQDPSVVAQMLNTQTGVCWEAVFSTAKPNDVGRFKAKSE